MSAVSGSAATRRGSAAGFTLLEVVVVLGIFGLVAVMAYGGLNNVLRTRQAIEANLEKTRELQRAYLRLRDDFSQLAPRTIRDGFGETEAAVLGTPESGVSIVRAGWSNPAGHPRPGLQRVSWRLENGRLLRSSFVYLDRAPNTEATDLVVLEGVDRLKLRYLDDQRQWQDEWPVGISRIPDMAASPAPPLAVEISLETDDWGELLMLFPTGSMAALVQGAGGGQNGGQECGGLTFGPGPSNGVGTSAGPGPVAGPGPGPAGNRQ